jgi:dienelactone hydrolase
MVRPIYVAQCTRSATCIEGKMKRLRWLAAGGLVLGVAFGIVWAQTPAIPPAPTGSAPGGHNGGVGADVPPEKPASDFTPKQTAARLAAWREQIRKILYVPAKLPALDAKKWSTFSPTPGVLADRVTYHTMDGMLVTAIVYHPDPKILKWKGKLPGIVMVNGHGSDKFGWYAMYTGMEYAKAGAMVVTYDMIGEGERNIDKKSRASSHDKRVTPPDGVPATDWGQRVAGLMQVDLMQGVSYLIAQPEIDPKRIAVMGYSMGSFVTGIAGAIDTRIHAIVLSGGGVFDGPGGYFDSGPLPCQGPPYRALQAIGDRSAILYALNAERGPMYIMNGSVDTVMDIPHHLQPWFDEVKARAIAVRGTDKDIFTTVFYPGVSHRPSWENRDAALWLNQNIHFAIWTDREIQAMPTIKVSDWAKENGVTVSPNDMREEREGGIDGLAVGLPNIKREDLMVLPESDWTAMKDQLIYEAWAAKMNTAEAAMAAKAKGTPSGE